MSGIVGVVYPIPISLVDRILKKKIFVKYLARSSTKLKPKHKVLFYISHGSQQVIGEGTIEKVEFLTPDEALLKYGDELLLNKEELTNYMVKQSGRTPTKKMLVLNLINIRKFAKEIKYPRPLTMTGEYLTKEEYLSLMKTISKGDSNG